jgi:hypothetical protein
MRYIFHRPPSRLARWREDFHDGRGPLFYAAAGLAAVGFYALLWTAMALF